VDAKTVAGDIELGRQLAMIYTVTPMLRQDIPQVIAIEKESFPSLWPPNTFRREIGNRRSRYFVALAMPEYGELLPPLPLELATIPPSSMWERLVNGLKTILGGEEPEPLLTDRRVVGYLGMWLMLDEAHITAIATKSNHRRRGVGERLLIASIESAIELAGGPMTLEVRVSNLEAQTLYEKFGFRKMGIRRGYYTDNKEDAIIMTTVPVRSDGYQETFQRLKSEHYQRWGMAVR
jgi:ribosomal-protein-alanine N-acetyltransferase